MTRRVATIVSHDQRDLLGGAWRRSRAMACRRSCARTCRTAVRSSHARWASAPRERAPATFAQNQNALFAATTEPLVLGAEPRCAARTRLCARLVAHADAHARCGVAGPRLLERDGTLQRSRRRFPTVGGTLVRRTPLRALVRDIEAAQPGHYLADLPDGPVECDWMLGACLLLRRAMLDEIGGFDEGFPMYGEDIELQYRAARRLGTLVRPRRGRDARLPARRRPHAPLAPHLWHLRGMARFVRRHPETLVRR